MEYPSQAMFNEEAYWIARKIGSETPVRNIAKVSGFWESIEPFPWAKRVVAIVDEIFEGNWIFCTKALRDAPFCHSEKYRWILKHFPEHADKLWITMGKKTEVCRSKFDILIDDTHYNIEHWEEAGGTPFRWIEMTPDIPAEILEEQIFRLENFLKEMKNEYEKFANN
jgi:hypothetical protein